VKLHLLRASVFTINGEAGQDPAVLKYGLFAFAVFYFLIGDRAGNLIMKARYFFLGEAGAGRRGVQSQHAEQSRHTREGYLPCETFQGMPL